MIGIRVRRIAVALIAMLLVAVPPAGADEWFARDKAQHFAVTAGLGAGGYVLASTVTDRDRWKIAAGIGAGIGAATAKELWDRSHGDASWRDFAWGAVGTAAGVTIAWAINRLRHQDDTDRDKGRLRNRTPAPLPQRTQRAQRFPG
jgi:uncharacterized protein YfiM (DUF2279 family)